MAAVEKPTLYNRRTKATFDLFKELNCLRDGGYGELKISDVGRLDEEKMMARALDCLAAVSEMQRVRVALKEPLKLREDGDALTPTQQMARNKVFRAALNIITKGLTHDGAPERDDPGYSLDQLLYAFPNSRKLKDGRGWLPMHWAIVVDEDTESDVTEADVMTVYETDLMALRTHHLVASSEVQGRVRGYTPAHLLCGLEMTEKNMSLVRQLSLSDPRAFTMKAIDNMHVQYRYFSALHVACVSRRRTEALLRLLVQLDPLQLKSFSHDGGPLGLLCTHSEGLDERQLGCLLQADSSVEVVENGIRTYITQELTFKDRVQTVAKLLEINPAAAQHNGEGGRNLAHQACIYSDKMPAAECIEILKLVLARHKDALKGADDSGELPAHCAAEYGPVEVLDFVLGKYPQAAAVVDDRSRNLLHFVTEDGSDEYLVEKARLLCTRYPDMVLQRDRDGRIPLVRTCVCGHGAMVRLLCEVGGREAASAAVVHSTNAQNYSNGRLPLHFLLDFNADIRETEHLSATADAFRLLLRLYPEAAGTEGGVGAHNKTPYQIAVDKGLPVYYRRLLLRAAPHLDPAELRRLNWAERRLAMFVAFTAVAKTPSLLARLRAENKDLVKHVVSFL